MNTEIRELNDAELEQIAGGKTWGDVFNNTINGLNSTIFWNSLHNVVLPAGLAGQSGTGPASGGKGGAGPVPA